MTGTAPAHRSISKKEEVEQASTAHETKKKHDDWDNCVGFFVGISSHDLMNKDMQIK